MHRILAAAALLWLPALALGSTITWSFQKTGTHPASVTYGTSLTFQVDAVLPVWATASDLRVEIYSASDTAALFSLCSPTVTFIGDKISGAVKETLNSQWVMEAKGGDFRDERAVLQFPNITNSGTSGTDNKISFTFGAMVLNSPRMSTTPKYHVSFGAKYLNGTKVWVGQAEYSWANATAPATSVTTGVTLTGPSQLMQGETGLFTATLTAGGMLSQVIMDIFAPLNSTDIMSVCYVGMGDDSGASFSCAPREGNLTFPKRILYDASKGEYHNAIATFDAGELINGKRRAGTTTATDDKVTFKIAARMLGGSTAETDYKLGIALQYNSAQIWTANQVVKAKPPQFVSPGTSPKFSISQTFQETCVGASVSIFLNISLPKNTASNYTVEVALPFNNSQALMTFQRLRVLHVGRNMPCLHYGNSSISLVSSANDSNQDYVTFSMGPITNLGIRSGLYDDDIAIEVAGRVLSHPLTADGGEMRVIAGVRFGQSIWVSSANFTVANCSGAATPFAQDPSVKLLNAMNTSTIYNGTTHAFYLEIYQPIGTQSKPMDIEIISAMDNNRAVLAICDVQLLHVGEHFVNISGGVQVTNVSTADDGLVDRVLVSFPEGFLSNVGSQEYPWTREQNLIRFQIFAHITPHVLQNSSNLMNDTLYWLGASVQFRTGKLYVARIGLTYDPTTVADNITTEAEAKFTSQAQTPNTTVAVGGTYTYLFNMRSVPQAYGHYRLDVVSMNDSLHICRVGLARRGKNVPCLGPMVATNKTPIAVGSDVVKEYELDLLNFANAGQPPGSGYSDADNTGVFDIVVQVKSGATGDSLSGGGVFYMGSRKLWVDGFTLTVNATQPPINFRPQFSVGMRNDSQQLVRNGMHTVVLEAFVPPDTLGHYVVDILVPFNASDRGKLHICAVRLVRAGWNLPCLNDLQLPRVLNDSYGAGANDRAQIDLGSIQNIGIGGDVTNQDNRFVVEADIFVDASKTTAGEVLWVGGSVNISNSLVWVGSKSVTVTDALPSPANLKPIVTPAVLTPTPMKIFEEKTFKFNVTIAEALVNFTLKVFANVTSDEARFTFRDLNVTWMGDNICCQDRLNFSYSNFSTNGNTQIDVVTANAIVGNLGAWRRHQWTGYHKDSDVLQFDVKARLMDDVSNTKSSTQYVYCELQYSGLSKVTAAPVTVMTAATDKTELQIFQSEEPQLPAASKTPSTELTMHLRINHTETSRGNAYSVKLYWYLPYVVGYAAFISSSPLGVTVENNTNLGEGLVFNISRITYTDDLLIVANVTVDPLRRLAIGSGNVRITLLADAFYTSRNHDGGNAAPTARTGYSPTFRYGLDVFVPECGDALGMESGAIADCQIKASAEVSGELPPKARPNSDKAWTTPHRGPPFNGTEFIEVNFGNVTRITAVGLKPHAGNSANRVNTFWLQRSDEGLLWYDVTVNNTNDKEVYTATYSGSSAHVSLPKAVVTRYIRLLPIDGGPAKFSRSLRVEFYGCYLSDDVSAAAACYETQPAASDFVGGRSYAVNKGDCSLYVCMQRSAGGRSVCSRSADMGASWEILDTIVSHVAFVSADFKRVYGTASDRVSRLRSDDNGWTWFSVPEQEFDAEKPAGAASKEVPWNDFSASTEATMYTSYGIECNSTHAYSVSMQGVLASTNGRASWSLVSYWAEHGWV